MENTVSWSIADGNIHVWTSSQSWHADLNDICVVGETTNEDGPFADDHFIVLIDKHGNECTIGFEDGAAKLLSELSHELEFDSDTFLGLSTSITSVVLFPAQLRGTSLYVEGSHERTSISDLFSVSWMLNPAVRDLIENEGRRDRSVRRDALD